LTLFDGRSDIKGNDPGRWTGAREDEQRDPEAESHPEALELKREFDLKVVRLNAFCALYSINFLSHIR
jgi:hypothetical protein